jgi:hypothetical protein
MAGVGASREAPWGSSPERGDREEWGRGAWLLGVLGGRAGCRGEAQRLVLRPCCSCSLAVREKTVGGRRREEKRREK